VIPGNWLDRAAFTRLALRSPFRLREEAQVIRMSLAVVVAALMLAPAVQAQDAPRFFIERIEVRNTKRVSPEVIVAESRLREGAEYSESELRDAAARLSRLPFLLAAEFALEKGSERGRHVLIVNVTETRSFFFRLDIVPLFSDDAFVNAGNFSQLGSDQTAAALGYRWFIGRRGALHIAFIGHDETEFTRSYSALAVGYTAYDILGTRAFATVNIKDTPEGGGVSPQVVVGVPLSLNQTLTVEYDETISDYTIFSGLPDQQRQTKENNQRIARMIWSYNTTNHPYLPTTGSLVSVTPMVIWRDEAATFRIFPGPVQIAPLHTRTAGLQASALRYWDLTDRVSVSGGIEGGWGVSDESRTDPGDVIVTDRYTTMFASGHGGISYSLWTPEARAQGGESRVELNVRARARNADRRDRRIFFETERDVLQASLSWVRHSSWGTFRIGAGYAW
jgi:hypothetical protein